MAKTIVMEQVENHPVVREVNGWFGQKGEELLAIWARLHGGAWWVWPGFARCLMCGESHLDKQTVLGVGVQSLNTGVSQTMHLCTDRDACRKRVPRDDRVEPEVERDTLGRKKTPSMRERVLGTKAKDQEEAHVVSKEEWVSPSGKSSGEVDLGKEE